MLTFRDLQLQVLRILDESVNTADTTLALVKDAINRSHRAVLSARTWPFMRWPAEGTFTTIAGIRTYALGAGTSKLLTFYDVETKQPLPFIGRREWQSLQVNRVDTVAQPLGVIYGDHWPVQTQPRGVVSLVSSSALDAAVTVELHGFDASGEATETLALTGTAPVTGTVAWTYVTAVTKLGPFSGTLTMTDATQTCLTVPAAMAGRQYPTVEFIETPASARTYAYTAQRTPRLLVHDTDIPDTPYPWSEIHVYDALLDQTLYNSELGQKHLTLWMARREALMQGLTTAHNEIIAGSRPRFVRSMGAQRSPYLYG